ncbi:multidrug resistance-associated protein 5 [Elysia marginata]|uniref:Multidrug resistance-associated protein 5 n=1 Tax=Elysia marginata TaxID=1093978 RepID=A0AAV4I1L5_9GAST|nr:multidrug resistance-associated protein 5 [Elysia marginata]
MGRFWSEEVEEKGESGASFGRAIFKSFKTRIIIGALISFLNAILMLANPIFVIRYFLAYLSEDDNVSVSGGLVYAVALAVVILLKGLSSAFFWMLNYEAAARIKYGSLALLYAKVLRLKSLGDKTVGDVTTINITTTTTAAINITTTTTTAIDITTTTSATIDIINITTTTTTAIDIITTTTAAIDITTTTSATIDIINITTTAINITTTTTTAIDVTATTSATIDITNHHNSHGHHYHDNSYRHHHYHHNYHLHHYNYSNCLLSLSWQLVNLVSNDGQRLWNGVILGPFIIGGPMILVISCVYGVIFLGPWALLSFFVIIGFFPFAVTLARLSQKFRARSIKITDKRVGLMVELFTSIKLIKMYAWETSFAQKIADIRAQEKCILEKSLFVQSVSVGSSMLVPLMASCLTFIGYVSTGNNLTATQAFTFVSLLNTIQASMGTLPFALKAVSEMVVTTRRIQSVLLMEEMKQYPRLPASSPNVVEMRDATFSWQLPRSINEKDEEGDRKGPTEDTTSKDQKRKRFKRKKNAESSSGKKGGGGGGGEGGVNKAADEEQILKDSSESAGPIFVGPTLHNITFTLKKGDLVGVCGSIASGKTSLINAILGKMELRSGTVTVAGRPVAYVPQQAWLTHGTLRDNILFGEPFDQKRYNQVIQACALSEDFASFACGDATEVGECGSTLSGGQKQRLSLARAAYSKHDLVLLDDPLSAVDVHLARHIFNKCILGLLMGRDKEGCEGGGGRTVVFVSHFIEYMKECNRILVVKEGTIAEQGSHDELLAAGETATGETRSPLTLAGEYAALVCLYQEQIAAQETKSNQKQLEEVRGETTHLEMAPPSEKPLIDEGFPARAPDVVSDHNSNGLSLKSKPNSISSLEPSTSTKERNNSTSSPSPSLIQEEQADTGALSFSVVHQWILSMGGYPVLILVFVIFCLPVAGVTTASWYLSYWLEQGGGAADNGTVLSGRVVDNPDLSCYLLVYASFIPALIVLTPVRSLSLVKATSHASSSLHDRGFRQILCRPLAFFLATPVGRIVNRFSADQDEMDMVLPMNVEVFMNNILQVTAALVAVSYVSPWFALAVLPLAALFLFLMFVFHVCFRRLKCMDHVTRSPVLAHLGASVQGLDAVQAYRLEKQFHQRQCQLLDSNSVALFLFQTASRWLALRLDLVSAGVALVTGLLILCGWDHINPAMAGLALAFSLQMSGLFQFTARLAVETEARFTSVQRMLEYCNDDSKEASSTSEPEKGWPAKGSIQFKNVSLRYRSDLPLALSGVSFDVQPQEKIGIVGRSGAGKSSLAMALFRLFEVEQGQICVDGQDIWEIPLEQLRSALSVIPQDPVLFAGTLRYNLDPFGHFSDADLWQALEKCHVSDMVKMSEHQLDTLVTEGGSNFSVGERQLLCLARALLRKSKIVILDEATAAVDSETDCLIQETLRVAFQECTMLVIAHRLATVLLCDKILVMDASKVLEFDTPTNLMSSEESKFKAMLKATESSS